MIDIEALDVAGPGAIFTTHYFTLVIQKVHHAALMVIWLDLLEALVSLQRLRKSRQDDLNLSEYALPVSWIFSLSCL
jgi:hypothetical protein